MTQSNDKMMPDITGHYNEGYEQHRLLSGSSRLEFARTQELLRRYLPPPPSVIYDVGGGPGAYALWLTGLDYTVHVIDAVPLHVEQARQAAEERGILLASASVGDARRLEFEEASADVVLLMGPLYHLTDRADRLQALKEAHRVLRPGGIVFAVGISRFASALDGLYRGYLHDPQFVPIVEQDLKDGQHRNPMNHPDYFTTAFFHHPDELREEVVEAGFSLVQMLAIEGPGWMLPNLGDFWDDPTERETLFKIARAVESEPSLLGVSAHLMAMARRRDSATK